MPVVESIVLKKIDFVSTENGFEAFDTNLDSELLKKVPNSLIKINFEGEFSTCVKEKEQKITSSGRSDINKEEQPSLTNECIHNTLMNLLQDHNHGISRLMMFIITFLVILSPVHGLGENGEVNLTEFFGFMAAACLAFAAARGIRKDKDQPCPEVEKLFKVSKVWAGNRSLLFKGSFQNKDVVIRRVDITKFEYRADREIQMLTFTEDLDNIVPLLFQVGFAKCYYIATPWYELNLQQLLDGTQLTLYEINKIMTQLINGVINLHNREIIHGDITPNHVLINRSGGRYRVVLSNLRRSQLVGEDEVGEFLHLWSAPEIVASGAKMCSMKSDVFSVSLIAYHCWIRREEGDAPVRNPKSYAILEFRDAKFKEENRNVIHALDKMMDQDENHRIDSKKASRLPIFWRRGALPRFFECLQRWIKRVGFQFPETPNARKFDWTGRVRGQALFTAMEQFSHYSNEARSFIRFIRNLHVHGLDFTESRGIASTSQELHDWVETHFHDMFVFIFDNCIDQVDETFMDEFFCGPLIQ